MLATVWEADLQKELTARPSRVDFPPSPIVRNWRPRHWSWRPTENRNGETLSVPLPNLAGKVDVASGGMCEGGLITHLLPVLLPLESTPVYFTGFQSPGSNGARLLIGGNLDSSQRERLTDVLRWKEHSFGTRASTFESHKPKEVTYPLSRVPARTRVGKGYSGHADQKGILDRLFFEFQGRPVMAGRTIFVNHGNNTEREALAVAIRARAAEVGHEPPPEVLMPSRVTAGKTWTRGAGSLERTPRRI